MYKYLTFLLVVLVIIGCEKKDKLDIDVSAININNTVVKRFDQEFYKQAASNLTTLKSNYPYLFPVGVPDSIWIQKVQNKDEQELFAAVQKQYPNFNDQKKQLIDLFKHIKYYYPKFTSPNIITILSDVDYDNRVVYADSLLILSLDVYLGKESNIYQDFPIYIKNNFTKNHLIVDVAEAFAMVQVPISKDRTFISRIIQEGKRMYLLDAYLPKVTDKEKIGYTQEQIDWAKANEQEVWKYFVQNNMLFSTEYELSKRFIDNAPFSKFYLANDNDTPGGIGVWLGWQIVRAYMQHNKTSLQKLLKIDNETIFKKSKYKPRK